MEKEQIKLAILHAIERGESIEQAVISLINAGYDKEKVFEIANEILKQTSYKEIKIKEIEVPKYKREKKEIIEKKLTEKEKKEKYERKRINFFSIINFFSLIFILYYLIILIIKYKNFITLAWILFGIPCLLTNIYIIFKKINKKVANILIIINLLSLIGLLLFIFIPNRNNITPIIKTLFSYKLFFIFPCFLIAIILTIIALYFKKS
ncbi:MAG: hypothetical protein QXM27_01475 [Candidatus Pacearchaeota archaeon]